MKRLNVAIACAILLILAAIALSQNENPEHVSLGEPATLPASLAQFYPPKSPAPVYMLVMHQLSRPLSGMMCDLLEGDMENAQKNFVAFEQQYVKVAGMVPEWSHMFQLAAVEKLGEALSAGKQEEVMAAMGQVGQTCEGCHRTSMPAVQHAYHWPDFDVISTEDPLSKSAVSFKQLMLMMETSMSGTSNDLQQGQLDNARRQLAGFEARFLAMSQTCTACHDTERKYYVDKEVTATIDALKASLSQEEIDPHAIEGMFQRIGQESCYKCHLVHIPAAYAKKLPMGM